MQPQHLAPVVLAGRLYRHQRRLGPRQHQQFVGRPRHHLQRDHQCHKRRFLGRKLTLVAAPHVLGLIKGSLDAPTAKLVTQTIPKELTRETTPELLAHLEKLLD